MDNCYLFIYSSYSTILASTNVTRKESQIPQNDILQENISGITTCI